MATRAATPPAADDGRLLTVEDLMARWTVGRDAVLRHVKRDGLPHLRIGQSTGRRPILRFRSAAVQAWEASRERSIDPAAATTAATAGPAPVGHDGVDRLARGRKGGKARPG